MHITLTRCQLTIIIDGPPGSDHTGHEGAEATACRLLLDRLQRAMHRAGVRSLTRQLPCRLIAASGDVAEFAERTRAWLVAAGCDAQVVDW